jgi:prephenate dehydrogenase
VVEKGEAHESGPQSVFDEDVESMTFPDPLELMGVEFKRTAIIGVGLIGGSIGLRMKSMSYPGMLLGHDTPEVLDEALERGVIDRGVGDLSEAVADADLIVLAVPIDEIVKILPTVLKNAKPEAVITDTAPAKQELCRLAKATEGTRATYIGGHPLAGSNRQGIGNADASLFENGYWLLTPSEQTPQPVRESLWWWVRMLGAYPLALESELHDRVMAMTTHVPFIVAVALSNWIAQQSNTIPALPKLATGNFQTMTAMAGLPLGVWEGVLRMNQAQVTHALEEFRTVLEVCAKDLKDGKLEGLWQPAHALQRKLVRERPGDWDANCELVVTAPDRHGTIARIAGLLAANEIGIRDIHVIYVRERRGGRLMVVLETRAEARRAMDLLLEHGYAARLRD